MPDAPTEHPDFAELIALLQRAKELLSEATVLANEHTTCDSCCHIAHKYPTYNGLRSSLASINHAVGALINNPRKHFGLTSAGGS